MVGCGLVAVGWRGAGSQARGRRPRARVLRWRRASPCELVAFVGLASAWGYGCMRGCSAGHVSTLF